MRRLLVFVGFLAILAPFAAAQRHGTMSARSMGSVPVRTAVVASPHVSHIAASGVMRVSSPARVVTRVTTTRSRTGGTIVKVIRPAGIPQQRFANDMGFSSDSFPAPGLGFDETHVAATRGRNFGAHRRVRINTGFFPFFDGGFFLSSPAYIEQTPPTEVQEDIVEPDTQEGVRRMPSRESAPEYSPEAAPAPQRESEQYVFVRRDGTVFFAVAYSWDTGMLRYVTQEGLRKSAAGNSLDLSATQQFNEQRGLSFHVPV